MYIIKSYLKVMYNVHDQTIFKRGCIMYIIKSYLKVMYMNFSSSSVWRKYLCSNFYEIMSEYANFGIILVNIIMMEKFPIQVYFK